MLDKNYKDLDNKGWNMMKSILDKEMPVKQNRNRLLILLLLFVIGSGGLGMYLLKSDFLSSKSVVMKDNINGQDLLSKAAQISSTNLDQNDDFNDHSLIPVAEKILNESQDFNTDLKKSQPKIDNSKQNILNTGSDAVNIIVNNFGSSKIDIENSKIAEPNNVIPEDEETELLEIIKKDIRSIEPLSFFTSLSTIDIRPFQSDVNYEERFSMLSPIKNRNPLFLRFYAGYSFPLYSKLRGPEIGINVGKDFSHRWGMEIGLHLLAFNKRNNIFSRSTSDYAIENQGSPNEIMDGGPDYASVEELGRNSVDPKYYSLVSQKLSKLYFLNVPLNLDYKITSRHQIGLGIEYHYLVNAFNDEINLSEIASSLSFNNSFLGESILLENNLLNRHNLSIKGQYRFLLTKKLGLSLSGNLGARKILKTEVQLDSRNRMSYMTVGVDYRL